MENGEKVQQPKGYSFNIKFCFSFITINLPVDQVHFMFDSRDSKKQSDRLHFEERRCKLKAILETTDIVKIVWLYIYIQTQMNFSNILC